MDQNLKALLGSPIELYDSEIVRPSVIYTAAIPYVWDKCYTLKPLSYDPAITASDKYQLYETTYKQLCANEDGATKLPHKDLGLRSDEDLLLYKIKKRPVVALSPCLSPNDVKGFPPHFADSVLCAPLYTIVDKDGKSNISYNPTIVQNITALKYPHVFPVPGEPFLDSKISILRLDRIQPIHIKFLKHIRIKLTRRWLAYIREWIRFYGTGKLVDKNQPLRNALAETLDSARTLLLEELAKQLQKPTQVS